MAAINLDLKYSRPQNEIFFGSLAKYNVVTKGRRFGLTRGAAQAFVEWAMEGVPYLLWGDTINGNIDRYYERYFLPMLKKVGTGNYRWNAQKRELKIFDSYIDFRSADKPENWEGFGYKVIFLNEAGIILEDPYLYDNAVLPMMMDYEDSILIAAGVPKGRACKTGKHKFFDLYEKASTDTTGMYRLLQYSSFDNPFLPPGVVEELMSVLDDQTIDQEIKGLFINLSLNAFCYAFSEEKHGKELFEHDPFFPLAVTFDFNKDPLVCYVSQTKEPHSGDLDIINNFKVPNGDIDALCDKVIAWNPNALWLINGDATGRNALTGNMGYYTTIKAKFNLSDTQIKTPKINPSVKNTRVLCNSMLQRGRVRVHPRCTDVINDMKYVQVKEDGSILKDRVSETRKSDFLDCFRYDCWEFHHKFIPFLAEEEADEDE